AYLSEAELFLVKRLRPTDGAEFQDDHVDGNVKT
ncbi:unnamed protein product, partial [Allacma fusca]